MPFDHYSGEYIDIDGAKIYYEVKGNENSPALLFLHGGFGNIEDFNPILDDVNQDYRVVGIDSRGQGKSTLGEQVLTYERIQKDVERVLEHLRITAVSIIGFSDGGIVGYRLASLSSLHVEKLTTIGSRWHIKNTEPTREALTSVTDESWRTKFPATYHAYQRLNPEPNFDHLAQSLVAMWFDASPSGYPNQAITNLACPLLIVRGDNDHLISKATVFELSEALPDANLLNIPFAGHAAFIEQKAIFLISLHTFLHG